MWDLVDGFLIFMCYVDICIGRAFERLAYKMLSGGLMGHTHEAWQIVTTQSFVVNAQTAVFITDIQKGDKLCL